MRVTAATVGVAHTFEMVTKTERVAFIGLRHWCAYRIRRSLYRLPKSEPWSNLEVGEWGWIFYRHLCCGSIVLPSYLLWRQGLVGQGCCPVCSDGSR